MRQRVNIQYSIEIDKIEQEVLRLVQSAASSLSEASTNFIEHNYALTVESLKTIDSLRQQLAHIDQSLNDINKIAGGYLSYQASLVASPHNSDAPSGTAEANEAPMQDKEALATVEQMVQNFKDTNAIS